MIVLLCLESPRPGRASHAALALAGSLAGNAQVVALSAGGPRDSASLGLARACPALARVIHLDDATLDQADFMTMGMVLAEAARHLGAGLVMAGERSDDEGQGLVPAALAHHLHAHLLARVRAVRLAEADDTVEVILQAGGQLCTVASPSPLVVTVPAQPGAPAVPAGSAAHDVETLTLAGIGLDASRLVPRPDLLGALVPAPGEPRREMTLAEAAAALARHR